MGGMFTMKKQVDKVDNDCNRLLKETRHIIAYLSNISIDIEAILLYSEDTTEDICQYQDNIARSFAHLNKIIQDYNLDMAKLNDDICLLLGKTNYTTLDDYYGPEYCGDN